ncbi:LOW QUALITY PROTEIN: hypothetical protein V2J09_021397 [Rumex salicifolius]
MSHPSLPSLNEPFPAAARSEPPLIEPNLAASCPALIANSGSLLSLCVALDLVVALAVVEPRPRQPQPTILRPPTRCCSLILRLSPFGILLLCRLSFRNLQLSHLVHQRDRGWYMLFYEWQMKNLVGPSLRAPYSRRRLARYHASITLLGTSSRGVLRDGSSWPLGRQATHATLSAPLGTVFGAGHRPFLCGSLHHGASRCQLF